MSSVSAACISVITVKARDTEMVIHEESDHKDVIEKAYKNYQFGDVEDNLTIYIPLQNARRPPHPHPNPNWPPERATAFRHFFDSLMIEISQVMKGINS